MPPPSQLMVRNVNAASKVAPMATDEDPLDISFAFTLEVASSIKMASDIGISHYGSTTSAAGSQGSTPDPLVLNVRAVGTTRELPVDVPNTKSATTNVSITTVQSEELNKMTVAIVVKQKALEKAEAKAKREKEVAEQLRENAERLRNKLHDAQLQEEM